MEKPCVRCGSIIQGGVDSKDVFSCRLFSAKEPLIIRFFCEKSLEFYGRALQKSPVLHV